MTRPARPVALTDAPSLARQARAALAEATSATLLVDGLGHCAGELAVTLHEHDGRPQLICDTGSPVGAAARTGRSALLSVAPARETTVVFAGTLTLDAVQEIDGVDVDLIGLRLRAVLIERDRTSGPMQQYELPLDVYFAHAGDVVAQYAARVLAHTNGAHREHVRRFVARRAGAPEPAIADAWVTALDRHGVQVAWVDEQGAHTVRADFSAPAATSAQLALALRDQLDH
jgi:uncharacterized protein DUF2470